MPRGPSRLRTPDGLLNEIGDRLRERRVALDVTQDALGGQLSELTDGKWAPDFQEIYRIEAGKRLVTTLELSALATVLRCDPYWLLTGRNAS